MALLTTIRCNSFATLWESWQPAWSRALSGGWGQHEVRGKELRCRHEEGCNGFLGFKSLHSRGKRDFRFNENTENFEAFEAFASLEEEKKFLDLCLKLNLSRFFNTFQVLLTSFHPPPSRINSNFSHKPSTAPQLSFKACLWPVGFDSFTKNFVIFSQNFFPNCKNDNLDHRAVRFHLYLQ